MLSIEKCNETLNRKRKNRFTKEEIVKIREFLYKMARIIVESKNTVSNER